MYLGKIKSMVVALTLKKYIYRCDIVLSTNDCSEAKLLAKEIVDVLKNYIPELTKGLVGYNYITDTESEVNAMEDIFLLREKLQKKLTSIDTQKVI